MIETKPTPRTVDIPKSNIAPSLASVILDAEDILAKEDPSGSESSGPTISSANWKAFEQAKMIPVEIICSGYDPIHPYDASCHSRLRLNAAAILGHIKGQHGNKLGTGFSFRLRANDGTKIWGGWKALADAGVEVSDFRCEICDQQIKFAPQNILKHMGTHNGKTRRPKPGGLFNTTLTFATPEVRDEDLDLYAED